MMNEQFRTHVSKFILMSENEFAQVSTYFQTQTVRKKENLLMEGQVCNHNYFILKGILRKFFINGKGIEQTTEFAIENWWMTDIFSLLHQSPTEFCIQAVEPVELLFIHRDAQEKLLAHHPGMEKYFRCVYQKAYAAAQMRLKFLYDFTREDLYHYFRKSQPEFLQRVPQYLIASYLNITPEYLSEIRRKSLS